MSLHQLRRERGAASVWMVFATIIVLAVAGLVYDGGGLIATKRQTINVAEQAARAGAQAIDTPTLMATGVAKVTCCQPDADSLVNVAEASFVPLDVQRLPMCVPVFLADL